MGGNGDWDTVEVMWIMNLGFSSYQTVSTGKILSGKP